MGVKKLSFFKRLFFILCAVSSFSQAATTLEDGDIAFTRFVSDNDQFSFVFLNNVESGTIFYITDESYIGPGFETSESTIKFTATTNISPGEEVHIDTKNMSMSTTSSNTLGTIESVGTKDPTNGDMLASAGDSLFVYQGTATSPTIISGINANQGDTGTSGNAWNTSPSIFTTKIPTGKTNGVNGFFGLFPNGLNTEVDNARYKSGATHSGNKATILAAIMDYTKWDFSNSTWYNVSVTAFDVSLNTAPTISGAESNQTVNDNAGAMTPFSSVVLADGDDDNISVTLSLDTAAKGTLSSSSIASGTVASVQSALRAITFTPAENRVKSGNTETTTITITVNDGTVDTNSSNTTIISTSINDAPSITSSAVTAVNEDSTYTYTLSGSDIDGDDLNWSVKAGTSLPSWLSLNSSTTVSTFAGSGVAGGDNGVGTSASFYVPKDIAVDRDGNFYVTDYFNNTIRKITPDANVTTFASGLNRPQGIAVDSSGNVYVGNRDRHDIKKITPDGTVTRFAGGSSGDSVGGYTAFKNPDGVAVDSSGNVYVADTGNHKIKKITPDGSSSLLAGSGSSGSTDGVGGLASFNNPTRVAVDSSGNVYVADTGNYKIRKITPDGNVTTFASTSASGITIGRNGNIYVVSGGIKEITPNGNIAALVSITRPSGIIEDSSGNFYVTTSGDVYATNSNYHFIKKIERTKILTGSPTNNDVGIHDVNLTLSDGTSSIEHNFQITVNNVNDVPTASNINFTIDEDTNKTFSSNDFNFSDVDNGDSLESIFITSLATKGSLKLNDTNVSLNQEINNTSISNLKFVPNPNENGTPYSIFQFKVNDGEAKSSSSYSATINVTAVDDTPVINTILPPNLNEDFSEYNITIPASDAEGDSISYSVSSSNSSIVTVSEINGTLVINSVENANGTATIEVNATANGKTTSQTFNINVNSVNDAPVWNIGDQNVSEGAILRVALYDHITDVENNTSMSFYAEGNDTSLADVTIDSSTLVVNAKDNTKGGVIQVNLAAYDGDNNVSTDINVLIKDVINPPDTNTSENNESDGSFVPTWVLSSGEVKYVVIDNVNYAVLVDADNDNKLSIAKQVGDTNQYEYVKKAVSEGAVTSLTKVIYRNSKLKIIYKDTHNRLVIYPKEELQ